VSCIDTLHYQERNLTAVESAEAVAKRAFRKFDKEGKERRPTTSPLLTLFLPR